MGDNSSMTLQAYRRGELPPRRLKVGDRVIAKEGCGDYSGVVVEVEGRSFTPDALVRADEQGYVDEMADVITGRGSWLVAVRQDSGRDAILAEDTLIVVAQSE